MMNEEKDILSERINYIDFLKFIGLTGIIIAHVNPPDWMKVLRDFDVPLMVILSAILGEKSIRKFGGLESLVKYCTRRIKRLVFPTWIFLIIFFSISFCISGSFHDLKFYIASFCMTRYGIGYVWVVLIYIYCAMLTPLYSRMKLSKKGIFGMAVIYTLYEVAYYFQIGVENKLIDTTFYYIVPYGVLAFIGFNYQNLERKYKYIITATAFAIFVGVGIFYYAQYGIIQLTGSVKYPPRLYYLAYGLAVSFLLLLICEKWEAKIYNNRMIRYVSGHSMWIYLWHILVLSVYEKLKIAEIWYLKLLIVYVSSVIIDLVINMLLDRMEKKKSYKWMKYLRS